MPKKCKVCPVRFEPYNSLQRACSPDCALVLARKEAADKAQKERKRFVREGRKRLKTKGDHTKEAQQAFNAYIRERDRHRPCISCGTYTAGQFHAGHYRTTKAAPELRFEELNCHKQCAQCNNFDSGNIVEYRIRLIQRLGQQEVDWLEGPHEPKRYTIADLERTKAHYRAELRKLQRKAA